MQPTSLGNPARYQYNASAYSLRGKARSVNQDVVYQNIRTLPDGSTCGLAILCDGLGRYQAGDIAGNIAVQTIRREIVRCLPWLENEAHTFGYTPEARTVLHRLAEGIRAANHDIYRFSQTSLDPPCARAGTALTAAVIVGRQAILAHVGNSRAYLLRNGTLLQLSRDHSLVADLVQAGVIPHTKARRHPYKNILTRAVGTQPSVEADFRLVDLRPGDKLLLCSNGLWSSFPRDAEMAAILKNDFPADLLAARLVEIACMLNGADDVSAVIVEIKPS